MNKILSASMLAALLGGLSLSAAQAESRDPVQRTGYDQTVQGERVQPTAPMTYEGRNVYVEQPASSSVEPYIARSVEQNARSSR